MGGKSSPQPAGSTTTTSTTTPWAGQQPFISFGYNQAQNLYNNNPLGYYPGETLAPVAPQTYQAAQLQQQRALSGSPVMNASDQNLTDTLNGSYLNSNPYLDATFTHAANETLPYVQAGFEGNGRFGSGAMANATADAVNNLATSIYGGNYQDERQRQLQASMFAPGAAANDYQDIAALGNVGSTLQNIGQNYTNEDIARFTGNQQAPYNQLGAYEGFISGNPGSTTATQSPLYQNGSTLGNVLSGAAGGGILGYGLGTSGLGTALGLTGPWGAALGAGLGLLGGI